MNSRTLGTTGPTVSAIGLGTMGMSDLYGPADEAESITTIHAAIDAGVSLIDTGDYYGSGHNELLIARALRDRDADAVTLSVKFGAQRDPAGGWVGFDASPAAVKDRLAHTLTRLGADHVGIYRPGRLDPDVPIEETVGAIAEMVQAGYVRHIGLSEVGAETLRRAAAVHPISDLQIEYSLLSRGIEDEILPTARELGIGVTAYAVLSRGLLSGHWNPKRELSQFDFRAISPRFQGANLDHNLRLVDRLRERRTGRDRLGAQSRRRHRPAGRRAASGAPTGIARRGRDRARRGRARADRAGRSHRLGSGRALCRLPDGRARQRELRGAER
jgi:aryl-alcohol dehydrogenase-like predicted oxidoreductase